MPLEYRQQLLGNAGKRNRLPSLFSNSGKNKQWKQASTLNGRPYTPGTVPRSPTYREVEFEGLLRGDGATKHLTLGPKHTIRVPPPVAPPRVSSASSCS